MNMTIATLRDVTPPEDGSILVSQSEIDRPQESAKNGKSSLMNLADQFSKAIETAERQHAQSLQEVIDAQKNASQAFQLKLDEALDALTTASEIIVKARSTLKDAVSVYAEDVRDTNAMIATLRDIRIKQSTQL